MAKSFLIICGLICVASATASTVLRKTVYVNVGSTFILPCRNETPGAFFALVWQSTVMPDKSSIFEYFTNTGYNVHQSIVKRSHLVQQTSLQIDNARTTDTGSYDCNIIYSLNDVGMAVLKSVITVVVSSPPSITSLTPMNKIMTIGDKPIITCKVNATPSANITWSRSDGKPIRGRILTNGMISILKMKRLKMADTAKYICKAENRAGITEMSTFLKVKTIPKIVSLIAPRINVDASGKLTCKAVGFPIPLVEWYISREKKDDLVLASGKSYLEKYRVSKTITDVASETAENSLFIYSVTVDDWKKNYTCLAANSEGSAIIVVNITGFNKPGRPRITNVKTFLNYAIVQWTIPPDGGSKILAYVVQYKNVNQVEWLSREIRPANVDKFQIMDLKPNTIYTFRIYAKNFVGMSDFSKEVTTNTKWIYNKPSDKPKTEPSNTVEGKDGKLENVSHAQKSKDGVLGSFGITALIGIFAGAFLALAIVGVIVFFLFRKLQKTSREQAASLPGSRPVSMENGSLAPGESRRPSAMPSETGEMIPLMTRADQWEFPRDRLRLSTVLGTGAFGMVMRGDALGIRGSIGRVKCAVKMVKDSDNECARKDLYAELDMLKLLPEHPNVVGLLGCCTRSEPLMIIVEYCANGDLQGFLRSSRGISERYYREKYGDAPPPKITAKTLLRFAWQIATGMNHLASFKVIHRDLAARNILVDENLVCKISDFGFARDIYVEDQYLKKSQGGRFPIKWMAIESLLDGISTSKSDVWSFAVVLWEIVTLGASPYPGMNSYEVVSFLQDGYRMDKPKHCADEIYALLMDCWHVSPQRRSTFEEIADKLKEMIDNDDQEFINMNFYQDHLYENFDVNLASQSSNNASAQELTMTDSTPLATGFS